MRGTRSELLAKKRASKQAVLTKSERLYPHRIKGLNVYIDFFTGRRRQFVLPSPHDIRI